MDFKVIYKDTFLDDLKRIVDSIADKNSAAAQKLGEAILDLCESLSFLPERHPRIHQRPEVRRFVARRHFKVFYRI